MDVNTATKRFTYSILLLIAGFAVAFSAISVLINHIIEHYQLAGSDQGLVISVLSVGNTLAVVSTLFLFRNMKKSTLLFLSGLLSVSMLALTGVSSSFTMLLLACLFIGVSFGWTDSYANSCIIDVNRDNSAKYQGALHGWYGVGAVLAPIAIQFLLVRNSWQEIYLILTPVVLLTVIVFMFTARSTGKIISEPRIKAVEFSRDEMRAFFKNKRNLCLILSMQSYSLMILALFAWTVRYMSVQYDAEGLGITSVTVMWVCITISRFFASRLPISLMKLHTYGSLVACAALAVGVLSDNALIMCIMIGVSGLSSGHSMPSLINEIVVGNEGGSQLPASIMILTTRISGVVVPPLLGFISVFSMQASMLVPIITVLAAGLLGFAIMRLKNEKIGADAV